MAKSNPAGLIAGATLFIFLTFLFFLLRFRSGLVPDYEGTEELNGLNSTTRIEWSETGFPTITAESDADALQALGFLHAQDFLFQMDYKRKLAQGRLSAWFGPDFLKSDLWYRSLNLTEKADSAWISASPDEKVLLEAYARGINEWIRINHNHIGYEYAELNTIPDFWEPSNSLLIQLWHQFSFSANTLRKEIIGEILIRNGIHPEIIPDHSDSTARVDQAEKPLKYKPESPVSDWLDTRLITMGIGAELNGSGKPWLAAGLQGGFSNFNGLAPVSIQVGSKSQITGMVFPGTPIFQVRYFNGKFTLTPSDQVSVHLQLISKNGKTPVKTPVSFEIAGSEAHYDFIRSEGGYFSVPPVWLGISGSDSLWNFRIVLHENAIPEIIPPKQASDSTNNTFTAIPEPAGKSLMLNNTNFTFSTLDPVFAASVTSDSLQSDLFFRFLERGYFTVQDFWDWWSVSFGLNEKELTRQLLSATNYDSSTVISETRIYLTEWVGEYADRSIGASLYEVSRYHFFRNWLEPTMGEDLFNEWYSIRPWSRSPELISAIAATDTLPFSSIPKRVQFILAFRESIRYLQENFGVTRFVWRWENLNNAWIVHPLHAIKPDKTFLIDYKEEPRPFIDRYDKPHFQRKLSDQVIGLINLMVVLPDSGIYCYTPSGYSGNIASGFYTRPDSLAGRLLPVKGSEDNRMILTLVPVE